MTSATLHGLSVGDQLGNLEYAVDAAALAEYQQLTGCAGRYPNLLADDCRALLAKRRRGLELTTVWRRMEFLRPPVPGRRVQVGGWLRDAQEGNDGLVVRVASFAVDEIGTEILRSEAAFAVGGGGLAAGLRELGEMGVEDAEQDGDELTDVAAGERLALGRLALPDGEGLAAGQRRRWDMTGVESGDDGSGLTALLSGWLEGRLGRQFGDDFHWGGSLALTFMASARPGDRLLGDAAVVGLERNAGGAVTTRLAVSVFNSAAVRVATGGAVITSPSPRLL